MSRRTAALHDAFLQPISTRVLTCSNTLDKPLDVELAHPLPPSIRVYMYTLVDGGRSRPNEFKALLRVRGQPVGEYGSFTQDPSRFLMLIAYHAALDVFVLWDASLHYRFKNGGNIQVRDTTVLKAAAMGTSSQWRGLSRSRSELVVACTSARLEKTIIQRLLQTGATSDQWATSLN